MFPQSRLYFGKNEESVIAGKKRRLGFLLSKPQYIRDYCLLEDNQTLMIDSTKVRVIYTPGHTTGHVTYQINDDIVISGDAVIAQNGFIKPFYRFFNMSHKKAVESARKILEFEGKYLICTAHTGLVSI